MDDNETLLRRARLRELIDSCFGGSVTLLLDFIEYRTGKRPNQGEMSALKKDHGKSFGDKKAKTITEQVGLHRTWFSMPLGSNLTKESWLSPSSDTQTESKKAESAHAYVKDSAMLLKFQKVSPNAISASDSYQIFQYASGGSMGYGISLPDQPGVIQNWSVSREWLNKNIKTHSGVHNLCIVTGFGPSMQPMFNPGDPLLVDTGVQSVIADGIYFFRVGNEGFVKQLQKIPTECGLKYIAKSKNPDYDNFEITEKMDFEVLGRVVRVWCGTDF